MARIMLVDDEKTMTSLLKTLLELDGFEVSVVARGMDVIPTAEKTPPDLIMMDYHLADVNGVQVLNALRKHPTFHQLPVVIASGMNMEKEALSAGANAFILKPFEPSDLPVLFHKFI